MTNKTNHMKGTLDFLKEIGQLKDIDRAGVLIYGHKNPDSTSDHTFRLAVMVWALGDREGLDMTKMFKMALVHNMVKTQTGDITPYTGVIDEDRSIAWRWRRLSLKDKERLKNEKFNNEKAALMKIVKDLPNEVEKDILDVWHEYEKMQSDEARFVSQLDRTENLLEAIEAYTIDNSFPTLPWWQHSDEAVNDETILRLMDAMSQEELIKIKDWEQTRS